MLSDTFLASCSSSTHRSVQGLLTHWQFLCIFSWRHLWESSSNWLYPHWWCSDRQQNEIVQDETVLPYPDPGNSQRGAILHRCGACHRVSDAKVRRCKSEKAVLSMCQCVFVFLTSFSSEASVYIHLLAFFSFVRWGIKDDIHSLFVTYRRWANSELFLQRQQRGINVP